MDTVAGQLRQAAAQLPADSGRLDAELLLAHVLGKTRTWLMAWPEFELSLETITTFHNLLARRQQGEPVAYMLGHQEFWSLLLQVTPDTLIPRPDTEVLVEAVLREQDANKSLMVLDAGTGSGAIAIALGKERQNWQMVACDYSFPALLVARANARTHAVPLQLLNSDWLSALAPDSFDVVVSNPPYIAPGDSHLPALAFEPQSALVAANEGLADILQIVRQAFYVLRPGGALYIEHGYDQAQAVRKIMQDHHFGQVQTGQDYSGNDRFTSGVKPI